MEQAILRISFSDFRCHHGSRVGPPLLRRWQWGATLADRPCAGGTRNADPATAETSAAAGQSPQLAVLNEVAVRLAYLVSQITPQEFGRQDANYERDSALGRELLFLIADDSRTRATSAKIAITRSDSFETTVQVDVELDRITPEAFRGRSEPIWLPLLVLPPLYPLPRRRSVWQRLRIGEASDLEPSGLIRVPAALATLGVSDMNDDPLPTLSNADIQHRLAAAVTEIILNMAEERWPGGTDGVESSARDQRLMLSAAVYRLLRGEHVQSAVLQEGREGITPDPGRPRRRTRLAVLAVTAVFVQWLHERGMPLSRHRTLKLALTKKVSTASSSSSSLRTG